MHKTSTKKKTEEMMKKFKSVPFAVLACIVALSGTGCKKNKVPTPPPHTHTYSEKLSYDEVGHWYDPTCDDTQEKSGYAQHSLMEFGDFIVCSDCEYIHTHSYVTEYSSDETGHWKESACGHSATTKRSHNYVNHVCSDCGYIEAFETGVAVSKTKIEYNYGETVNIDDISVSLTNAAGSVDKQVTSDNYTVTYAKDGTVIDNLTNVAGGVYQIWVSADIIDAGVTYTVKNFVLVYIVDSLTSISFKSGTTTQNQSQTDGMTDTWVIEATYASGTTKEIAISDCTITGVDKTSTNTAGSYTATVSYTELVGVNATPVTKTVDVPYTITEAGGEITDTITINSAGSAAGEKAYDGALVSISGSGALTYSNNANMAAAGKEPHVGDVKFTEGLRTNSVTTGLTTDNIYFTAKGDIELTIYVNLCNDGHNSDRTGTINYKVNDGEEKQISVAKRINTATITVKLAKGDVLTVNGTYTKDDSNNAKLWFYGGSAVGTAGDDSEEKGVKINCNFADIYSEAVTYTSADGAQAIGETGLTVIPKSDVKITKSTLGSYTTRFALGGSIDKSTGGNGVKFTLDAGTYKFKVVYSQASGRYIDLYKISAGTFTLVESSDATVDTSTACTFEYTLEVTETTEFVFGSRSSGMYLWEIDVESITE